MFWWSLFLAVAAAITLPKCDQLKGNFELKDDNSNDCTMENRRLRNQDEHVFLNFSQAGQETIDKFLGKNEMAPSFDEIYLQSGPNVSTWIVVYIIAVIVTEIMAMIWVVSLIYTANRPKYYGEQRRDQKKAEDNLKGTRLPAGKNDDGPIQVGDIVGGVFSIKHKLGQGTYGQVFAADLLGSREEVNNAGAAGQGANKSSFDASLEDFDCIINLNLRSVLALTKLALPHLEKTQGSAVNVSSIASTDPSVYFPYYSVAKAGLDHLTRSMAMAFIEKGIRVNCVNPGLTRTKFLDRMGVPQEFEDKMMELMCSDRTQMPIGRAAHPKEVGELILFLADRAKSEYIVGQCIIIDGGRSLTRPVVKELLPPAK